MNKYHDNKAAAVYISDEPSLTDQSQAADTDINVIIRKFNTTGTAPGAPQAPVYGDFSEFPTNLRDMMETRKELQQHIDALPPQLQELTVDELLQLQPHELAAMLKKEKTETPESEAKK